MFETSSYPELVKSFDNVIDNWFNDPIGVVYAEWPDSDDMDIPFALSLMLCAKIVRLSKDGRICVDTDGYTYILSMNRIWTLYRLVRKMGPNAVSEWVSTCHPHMWVSD